jgi:thioredoxin 1
MSKIWKIAVVVALAAVVAVVLIKKQMGPSPGTDSAKGAAQVSPPAAGLPRLVDLGSVSCIPCKMMAPILEELKKEYAGRLQVDFIDVMANPDAGRSYQISLIPTQIFFDASGKERFRHEGFLSKEDILAKWKELGVDLSAGAPAAAGPMCSRLEPAPAADRQGPARCLTRCFWDSVHAEAGTRGPGPSSCLALWRAPHGWSMGSQERTVYLA